MATTPRSISDIITELQTIIETDSTNLDWEHLAHDTHELQRGGWVQTMSDDEFWAIATQYLERAEAMDQAAADVQRASEQLAEQSDATREARQGRDAAVRRALHEGFTPTEVAAMAGLSREAVRKIRVEEPVLHWGPARSPQWAFAFYETTGHTSGHADLIDEVSDYLLSLYDRASDPDLSTPLDCETLSDIHPDTDPAGLVTAENRMLARWGLHRDQVRVVSAE